MSLQPLSLYIFLCNTKRRRYVFCTRRKGRLHVEIYCKHFFMPLLRLKPPYTSIYLQKSNAICQKGKKMPQQKYRMMTHAIHSSGSDIFSNIVATTHNHPCFSLFSLQRVSARLILIFRKKIKLMYLQLFFLSI